MDAWRSVKGNTEILKLAALHVTPKGDSTEIKCTHTHTTPTPRNPHTHKHPHPHTPPHTNTNTPYTYTHTHPPPHIPPHTPHPTHHYTHKHTPTWPGSQSEDTIYTRVYSVFVLAFKARTNLCITHSKWGHFFTHLWICLARTKRGFRPYPPTPILWKSEDSAHSYKARTEILTSLCQNVLTLNVKNWFWSSLWMPGRTHTPYTPPHTHINAHIASHFPKQQVRPEETNTSYTRQKTQWKTRKPPTFISFVVTRRIVLKSFISFDCPRRPFTTISSSEKSNSLPKKVFIADKFSLAISFAV